MKIAVVSMIHEPWGGSEELWAAMAHNALDMKHEIFHSTLSPDPLHPKLSSLINRGMRQTKRRGLVSPGTKRIKRIFYKTIWFIVNKFISNPFSAVFNTKQDIVVYNGTCYSIADDEALLKKVDQHKTRFFIIAHYNIDNQRMINEYECEKIKLAFKKAESVFFVSERNLATARRQLIDPIVNAKIIRNPVNLASTEIVAYPKEAVTQFAMVGNLLVNHKGQDLILEVLSKKIWKDRDWHLNIYGNGRDKVYLEGLIEMYGLKNNITFHGRVSDIRKVWSNNHLLLMPSFMEGMPLAVVEAMICGRPALVTDVGGHSEWITDGVEGFVAPAASVASLEKTMEICWQQKHNWEQMGLAAHKKALQLYDPNPGQTLLDLMTHKN
jgi:glycosyltransferase involved in cell wall biosynthesis